MAEHSPLDPQHIVSMLTHLEKLIEADLIAWDERSAIEAQHRVDRLTDGLKHIVEKLRAAL